MAATSPDIRSLIRSDRTQPDSAAVAHVVTGTGFLALGSVAAALTLVSMTFPSFLPLGYGIFRSMAMLALVAGFATLSLVGLAYFVLPRLTGARLWSENLAWLGLLITAATTAAGLVVVGVGLGDGREPFALPWWLDLPMLAGLAVPPLVAVMTVRSRVEHRTYVTVPYVVTALAGLPLLYLAGNIPGITSVATALGDFFYLSASLVVLIFLAVGLVYYAVVKQSEQPLAGRQLSQVGYWSLLFGAGWFGAAQLISGPIPEWLASVAAVLGLGFPVGLAASSGAVTATLEGRWRQGQDTDPVVMTAVAGLGMGLLVSVLASVGSFRSTATLVAFTPFWEGIVFGLVLGAIPLLVASSVLHTLPRMTGRALFAPESAGRMVKLILLGAGGAALFFVTAGLVTGYSWAGGSFTGAYAAVGDGWSEAGGSGGVFLGLATVAGLIAIWGNLILASLVTRTITRGRVTTQEVLVTREEQE